MIRLGKTTVMKNIRELVSALVDFPVALMGSSNLWQIKIFINDI